MKVKRPNAISSSHVQRKSMFIFILLAFGVPWLGWITAIIIGLSSPYARILFYFGDGCSLAGLIATWYAIGRKGLIDLLKRAVNPMAPLFWWMYAVSVPVLWLVISYLLYGFFWKDIGHIKLQGFLTFGAAPILSFWLTGSFGEEFGWRGFLLPRMLRIYSPLKAAIFVGVVWAIWHAPLYYTQWIASPIKGFNFLISVISFSIFLTALYIGTRGNILLCMFMHWMINASQSVIGNVFPDIGFTPTLGTIELVVQLIVTAGIVLYFKLSRRITETSDKNKTAATYFASLD